MSIIRIAAISTQAILGNPKDNLHRMIDWIARAADSGVQLAIFPECSLTGYEPETIQRYGLPRLAEEISILKTAAEQQKMVCSIGFMEQAPDGCYITQACLGANVESYYRKSHLTIQERRYCLSGNELTVSQLGFANVGTLICYDTAFPQAADTLVSRGADILIAPVSHAHFKPYQTPRDYAAAIALRKRHIHTYWRGRAYDLATYAVYVDQTSQPDDTMAWYTGYAVIFGPDGDTLAERCASEEGMILADIPIPQTHPRRQIHGRFTTAPNSRPELYDR